MIQDKTKQDYATIDLASHPLMLYYEVTRACDLLCHHCRASAQSLADPEELTGAQSRALLDQAASFDRPPVVVFTGGDPLKRPDLFELIRDASDRGLQTALTPSATPLATLDALQKAKTAGIRRLGISLDGADAATHDRFRGWQGSFERTLGLMEHASQIDLPVQVNTTITQRNVDQVDAMAELFASKSSVVMWSLFFLIPVGRGTLEPRISPHEYEVVFEKLWRHAQSKPYAIKTTEAPHYRRFVMEQGGDPIAQAQSSRRHAGRPRNIPLGIGDGKGIMFVSHTGEIFPAGFLPLECGRFPEDSIVDVYQNHPVFLSLRDPDHFGGKCGICDYRDICGGSRSRAYAVTGDPLAAEPDCTYSTPTSQKKKS